MATNSGYGNSYDSDKHLNNANNDQVNEEQESLLYHEGWNDTQRPEVDEDFVEYIETPPSVDVLALSTCRSIHPLNSECT